jgi:hypothetical protein
MTKLAESADSYPHRIAVLNDRWRVIECRHGLQWILQYRASAETYLTSVWRSRSYCATSEALIRCRRQHAGVIDAVAFAILEALPERIDGPGAIISTDATEAAA